MCFFVVGCAGNQGGEDVTPPSDSEVTNSPSHTDNDEDSIEEDSTENGNDTNDDSSSGVDLPIVPLP